MEEVFPFGQRNGPGVIRYKDSDGKERVIHTYPGGSRPQSGPIEILHDEMAHVDPVLFYQEIGKILK